MCDICHKKLTVGVYLMIPSLKVFLDGLQDCRKLLQKRERQKTGGQRHARNKGFRKVSGGQPRRGKIQISFLFNPQFALRHRRPGGRVKDFPLEKPSRQD